jgi:hypothetical protein
MDRPAHKRTGSFPTISPPISSHTTIRRRRFFILTVLALFLVFCFGVPWDLPTALKDIDITSVNRGNVAKLAKSSSKTKVDEIFGLLHLVTGDEAHEHALLHLDPTKPIDMSVYATGEVDIDWNTFVQEFNKHFPVVMFSKVRSCYFPWLRAPHLSIHLCRHIARQCLTFVHPDRPANPTAQILKESQSLAQIV